MSGPTVLDREPARLSEIRNMRLRLPDWLAVESSDREHVTVVDTSNSRRLQVSHTVHKFLCLFRTPRRIEEVLVAQADEALLERVSRLVSQGLLIQEGTRANEEKTCARRAVPYRFCNAPGFDETRSCTEFTVFGVPYDLASAIECRDTPASIRRSSLEYPYLMDFESCAPRGWLDANSRSRILKGATLSDAGDLHVRYGESGERLSARLTNEYRRILASGSAPVILGGDASISARLGNCTDSFGPRVIVRLFVPNIADKDFSRGPDASLDAAAREHRIDVCRLSCDDPAAGQDDSGTRRAISKVRSAIDAKRRSDPHLAGKPRAHLSIDVGAFSEFAKSDRDSDGISPVCLVTERFKDILREVSDSFSVISIDLVEADSMGPYARILSHTCCQLLLLAMSAIHENRSRPT